MEAAGIKACGWAEGKALVAKVRVPSGMSVEGMSRKVGLALEQQVEELGPGLGTKWLG